MSYQEETEEGDEGEGVDVVCQAIARNEQELQSYCAIEAERVKSLGNVSSWHISSIIMNFKKTLI